MNRSRYAGLRVDAIAVQRTQSERSIRVKHQRVQASADHRLVASMFLQGPLDVGLDLLVRLCQNRIHLDAEASSSYEGSASEMSSCETQAQSSIRNRPERRGDAAGRRRTRVVTLGLSEQTLSAG